MSRKCVRSDGCSGQEHLKVDKRIDQAEVPGSRAEVCTEEQWQAKKYPASQKRTTGAKLSLVPVFAGVCQDEPRTAGIGTAKVHVMG